MIALSSFLPWEWTRSNRTRSMHLYMVTRRLEVANLFVQTSNYAKTEYTILAEYH